MATYCRPTFIELRDTSIIGLCQLQIRTELLVSLRVKYNTIILSRFKENQMAVVKFHDIGFNADLFNSYRFVKWVQM
jgi:hypothetical protein